jgi:hypothetical protein
MKVVDDLRLARIFATVVALSAAVASCPALAQEDAPATDGDVVRGNGGAGDGASGKVAPVPSSPDSGRREGAVAAKGGVEPMTPGAAGLQRRANLKMLIANMPKTATGLPASNTRIGPAPVRASADPAGSRNAIGVVTLGIQTPGRSTAGFTTPAGTYVTGAGLGAANGGGANLRQMPVPPNARPPYVTGINGTTMGHMASGPGSIGGPAKDHSGINGTFIRPKH